MNKEELKKILEDDCYDKQYLIEKNKELDKFKEKIISITERYKVLDKSYLTDDELELKYKDIIKNQIYEEDKLLKLFKKRQTIEKVINLLNQPYKTLFYLKYICSFSFDQIAYKMNYSSKRIYQLHNEGMTILLNTINKTGELSLT